MTLRSRIIRLAHQKPELRPHLLPLLEKTAAPTGRYSEPELVDGVNGWLIYLFKGVQPYHVTAIVEGGEQHLGDFHTLEEATKEAKKRRPRIFRESTKMAGTMDPFTKEYFETALWSSTDDEGRPMDSKYGIRDIDLDTQRQMIRDCDRFQQFQHGNFEYTNKDETKAGQNFWLSRNGHGAGFSDDYWDGHSRELQAASERFGKFNLYVGDDGKIHGQRG
jgi:hypothetical protein